jgi:hypothetical protein
MRSSAVVAGLVVAGAALAAALPARAESHFGVTILVGHGDDRYRSGYGYADASRVGYSRGFQEGYDRGRDDGEDHDHFDFWREKHYRNADSGYHGSYGPKCDYQRGYRAGYEAGYRRAYAQAAGYDDRGRWDHGYAREIRRDRDWDADRERPWDDRYRR